MDVQAEYKDICAHHEYEFCIHLHYTFLYASGKYDKN